ncbi:ClbS/DfsB family four-helix bundle protein [Brenneria goodwinii]|uniref:ClbS/DfsB family four-helix bundle protein n=1 Tax=Brenneria goodwinii TaxID=1109412 RepID=UPI000EF1F6F7|nr:ClbS/DfsB family four-helix bundle protein [Brenneria goodwinii]MCG8156646.1 ClbS/DfsB family four-helix bundle protein [Brenneria goodwinii]MCG8159714.1 ClbS/DfsB family four-helix bundle protein [Brenneria goodwinii]MCG8165804.1 ClbS/DfsB family four-helix bundle protein [Brenneria goodwinii]MCG8170235.1 ClbS/DfsB family four-helix bundle protein [Brenneria goodwinii]MCG8173573.1 ClbS/DfsB family four-helix bundle protein [Brenneria goodwinii]
MSVPDSKDELIKAINSNFASLMKRINAVPPEHAFVPEMPGHAKDTQMSAANLLAYLLGWGDLVLKWHESERQNLPINFPETGFKWNQLGLLAQKFYQDYAHVEKWSTLIELLVKNKANLLALIDRYSNEQLYGAPWYGKWTRGRMIQFNTASPYKNAAGRLRDWEKKRKSTDAQ